jgi:holo-[acyl-carrier-protein] synthase
VAYLATRFSAKEAFSKAIGLGIRMPMTWRDCEILNEPSGKPLIRLSGELAEWFARGGLGPTSPSPTRPTTPRPSSSSKPCDPPR